MPFLWSAPNPQGATPAQLQAGAQINPINMQGVVAAILEHQRQAAAQQQAYQQQIAQGVNALAQRYQQGEADDAANRAQYQARYPMDTTDPGSLGYNDRVPDYGGTQGLHSYQIAQKLQDEQATRELQPMHRQLLEAQIANLNERTANGGLTAGQRAIQERFETRQSVAALDKEIKDAKAEYSSLGVPPEVLTSTTGVHSKLYAKPEDATADKPEIPAGNYRLDIPQHGNVPGYTKDIEASQFDKAHAAYEKYQQLLDQRSKVGSKPSGGRTYSDKEQQAAAWAYAHQDDPRSQAILQRLGLQ